MVTPETFPPSLRLAPFRFHWYVSAVPAAPTLNLAVVPAWFVRLAGWPLRLADRIDVVAAPTGEELRILRDLHARTRAAHACRVAVPY